MLGIRPGLLHVRQVPYLLCNHSSLLDQILSMVLTSSLFGFVFDQCLLLALFSGIILGTVVLRLKLG